MPCLRPWTTKLGDVIPCGHCNLCLQMKRMDWCFRLSEEQRVSRSSYFLTLTYDDDHLPSDGNLVKRDVQLFMKNIRSIQLRDYSVADKLRYYLVGEYGEKFGRPHYHVILFNLEPLAINSLPRAWDHKGNVYVGTVTGASIGYVTGYCINRWNHPGRVAPFLLCRSGRGSARPI